MKKLLALLILPGVAFAGKIGENYLGLELGSTKFDFDASWGTGSVSSGANGFSFGIGGNYNLYEKEDANYGVDLSIAFHNGSGDEKVNDTDGNAWNIDSELSIFTVGLRPHYDFGGIKVFADLAFLNIDTENKTSVTTTTGSRNSTLKGDASEFLYGLGLEFSFSDTLTFQPSVLWSESPNIKEGTDIYLGNDLVTYSIPFSYSYSETIDITAAYYVINNDDLKEGTVTLKNDFSSWSIGIDYKF